MQKKRNSKRAGHLRVSSAWQTRIIPTPLYAQEQRRARPAYAGVSPQMRLAPSRTDRSQLSHFQKRDDHWAIIDLHGKAPPVEIPANQIT
jgi:hypothetical protein